MVIEHMANVFSATPFSADEASAMKRPDPQPVYAGLAARCPIHTGPDGTRTLLRMKDIVAVNKRPDVLGPGAHGPTFGGQRPLVPLDLDGPEHLKFRRLLDPLFSAKKVASLEPQVRELADALIDGFIGQKEADLQAAYCEPLPSIFFLRLMGLPAGDLATFVSLKNAILGRLPPGLTPAERMAKIREASAGCYEYLGGVLDARAARKAPGDDLIGWLLSAEAEGHRLTREQVLDISYLMIPAGLDTVASSLGCMLARLARDPALRRRLVAAPALWAPAVDELLRFESPVPLGYRTPSVDLEIGGEVLPAGTTFFLSWASANLDPEAFAGPLALDPERHPNPHVAFGSGFHRCLGTHLARLELRVALEQLHRRIPDYALKDEHALAFSGMTRTVNGLPVVWP